MLERNAYARRKAYASHDYARKKEMLMLKGELVFVQNRAHGKIEPIVFHVGSKWKVMT